MTLRLLSLSLVAILTVRAILAPPPCPYNQQLEETITGELLGTGPRTLDRDLTDFWANRIHLPAPTTLARYHKWANRLPSSCTKDAYLRAITAFEKD